MATIPHPRGDLGLESGYHSPQLDTKVRLNANESPFPPPSGWLAALTAELGSIEFNRYPDREARALREALASFHNVEPEEVFCANGSNEVIQCLAMVYGGPGRKALVFEPSYALHPHIARLVGTKVIEADRDEGFNIDGATMEEALRKESPELTFVCSPNNPTGGLVERAVLERAIDNAPGLVVVDEAYGQFAQWSALEAKVGARDRGLVVVRTFSKTWSMAAARLGYLVADPDVVSACESVSLPYHLDAMTQAAGRLALEFAEEMDQRVSLIVEEREGLIAAMEEMDLDVWPSQANFILFRPVGRDADQVWDSLVADSVLVRNTSSWPRLDGCLRVTVGTAEENGAFLDSLGRALGS